MPKAADAEQVRGDARDLAADHADGLPARRQRPAHELFHGQRVGHVVRDGREVIQPIRVGDELVVVHVLGDLFVAAMQVADVRRGLGDDLAIELEDEPQHPVRRRVRRPHVEDELFPEEIRRVAAVSLSAGLRAGEGIGMFEFCRGDGHGGCGTVRSARRASQAEFVKRFTSEGES